MLGACVLVLIHIEVIASSGQEHLAVADASVEVDYTSIAGEAEMNKQDILTFLNQTHIQAQYKELYESLLNKLIGKPTRGYKFPHR